MKVLTLGIIYGMTARGIARHLGIQENQARSYQEKFIGMFPGLKERIEHQQKLAESRDHVSIMKGVKRYKGRPVNMRSAVRLRDWERNWFVNTPIQGSAAIVFKNAGNKLRQLHEQNGSSLILSVHDSFIFETPLGKLEDIAEQTRKIMCNTLKSFFPVLTPRVDINIDFQASWNKDGNLDLNIEDMTEQWMDI
jgi:DNA polymerase-1